MNADTEASYLGMNVNLGYRDIGRFYPAWLSLVSNEWNYADDHDDFMYMDQPVSYGFVVEAQNMQGGATTNYGEFASSLLLYIGLFLFFLRHIAVDIMIFFPLHCRGQQRATDYPGVAKGDPATDVLKCKNSLTGQNSDLN